MTLRHTTQVMTSIQQTMLLAVLKYYIQMNQKVELKNLLLKIKQV